MFWISNSHEHRGHLHGRYLRYMSRTRFPKARTRRHSLLVRPRGPAKRVRCLPSQRMTRHLWNEYLLWWFSGLMLVYPQKLPLRGMTKNYHLTQKTCTICRTSRSSLWKCIITILNGRTNIKILHPRSANSRMRVCCMRRVPTLGAEQEPKPACNHSQVTSTTLRV